MAKDELPEPEWQEHAKGWAEWTLSPTPFYTASIQRRRVMSSGGKSWIRFVVEPRGRHAEVEGKAPTMKLAKRLAKELVVRLEEARPKRLKPRVYPCGICGEHS